MAHAWENGGEKVWFAPSEEEGTKSPIWQHLGLVATKEGMFIARD